MAENIDILVKLIDEASANLQKVQNELSGLEEKANEAKSGIGSFNDAIDAAAAPSAAFAATIAAAGVAVLGFGSVAVSAYNEAAVSQAQLEHAVLGVTGATQEQLAATMALADSLEAKGVLDGDNIKTGLAQLSTFGLTNEAVQGLGGSLADLAVNQFGVNASGEQLSETANMIAKALNGQFGVLEKSGIRFTQAQQDMISYGTEMEKVQAINEGFAQNLKFTNEVAMGTAAGGIAHLKVQLGNLTEAIGGPLSEVVANIVKGISEWIDANGGAQAIIDSLMAKIKSATDFLKQHQEIIYVIAGAIVGALVPAFIAGAAAAWAFVSPLLPFIAIGAAVGAAIFLIVKGVQAAISLFNTFVPILKTLWDYFTFTAQEGDSLNDSLVDLPEPIRGVAKAIGDVIAAIHDVILWFGELPSMIMVKLEEMKMVIGAAIMSIVSSVIAYFTMLWTGIQAIWTAITAGVTAFLTGVQLVFNTILALIVGSVILIFQKMGIDIIAVLKSIGEGISAFWETVKTLFMDGVALVSGLLTGFLNLIAALWSATWNGIVELATWVWDTISGYVTTKTTEASNTITGFLTAVSTIWTSVWSGISAFASTIWNSISTFIKSGLTAVINFFTPAIQSLSAAWTSFWNGAATTVENVWEGVKATVKSGINWVIDKINSLIQKVNSVISSGAGALGIKAITIPTIPLLAKGGDVVGAGDAIVGENGPEMLSLPRGARVTPLDKNAGVGGPNITIQINNPTVMDKQDILEKIGDPIMAIFKQHFAVV